jgi:uncharacterized protein involved in exopolysaccharide biosynthesis
VLVVSRSDADEAQEEEGAKTKRPGLPVDVHRLLRALKRGRWWLLTAAAIGSALGLLVGKFAVQHTYEATASIRYEGLPGQDAMDTQRDLPSLVSITHSEPMMMALRARMGMDGVTVDTMRRFVQVMPDTGSGLVSFTGAGESPERAALMANTIVELFLEHHQTRRRNEIQTGLTSLNQRIRAATGELREARRTYDGFRERNHITDLTAEQEQAIASAAELRSQADLAQAEIQALEARVRQLEGALQRTPRMEAVETGSSEGGQRLAAARARLREARATLSDEHPTVQALERQVEALERAGGGTTTRMSESSLHGDIETSLQEARAELEATRNRQVSLEQLAEQAQERTNRFSTIEGQAAGLLAQVNVKQALLTELTEQKARAEDELRDIPTGFRAVADARPPESAVPSKKKYIVAAAIPTAFMMIMLGMLFYRELRGLRVQTPAEVAWWGNGPVIGSTTWPRNPRALIDLVADMDDFAPEAKGTMLVVGATEPDRELAAEIASQLNHDWSSTTLIDVPVIGALPPPKKYADHVPSGEHFLGEDDDDDPISGEIHDGPTELVLAGSSSLDLDPGAAQNVLSAYAPPPPRDLDDPAERLICTAWNGPSEGQALRRAARLADRVLVVVTSNGLRASELAQMKQRLGRREAVGYVLVGVSDDIARLPDRAGPVEDFWEAQAVLAK